MEPVHITVAYLIAGMFFILSLRGLSNQETAKNGNVYGIAGMALAVFATIVRAEVSSYELLVPAIAIGATLGAVMAARVSMEAMPELVALLHSFVGLAAVLVGVGHYLSVGDVAGSVTKVEVFIDVWIGAITFTGSIIAFLKLKRVISGNPLVLPGRHLLNLGIVVGSVVLCVMFAQTDSIDGGLKFLIIMIGIASLLGMHLVAAIGGGDMPVVVSMLNSYSGWTATAAGFMLGNNLLIITGALVGSSGAILSYIMCKAMNRSIVNVIFGGIGTKAVKPKAAAGEQLEVAETNTSETAEWLRDAKSVVIVPGYGMAGARAQHAVREATETLRDMDVKVRFAIHPVAGRLPGHMNVLLAEANVPYPIVLEMDEINADLPDTDVVLVVGANDIVNPGAQTDEDNPMYGMPVLEVWKARRVVVLKRSRATGYAGVDNPLFYHDATRMLFGDCKASIENIVTTLRAA